MPATTTSAKNEYDINVLQQIFRVPEPAYCRMAFMRGGEGLRGSRRARCCTAMHAAILPDIHSLVTAFQGIFYRKLENKFATILQVEYVHNTLSYLTSVIYMIYLIKFCHSKSAIDVVN